MFEVGDRVKWSSHAGRGIKQKEGVIVAVVPVHKRPCYLLLDYVRDRRLVFNLYQLEDALRYRLMFDGLGRKRESYLVAVLGRRETSRKLLYWPRVSHLEKIDEGERGKR